VNQQNLDEVDECIEDLHGGRPLQQLVNVVLQLTTYRQSLNSYAGSSHSSSSLLDNGNDLHVTDVSYLRACTPTHPHKDTSR